MNNSRSLISGLSWSFAERFGAQLVSFVVSIILARLLMPHDYGVIAIVMIFIGIADAFVTGGFGNSLIQKKNADQLDFSSMFYFNLAFSIFIYLVIFSIAPFVESFFGYQGLSLLLRVLGIRILFTGVNSIQRAYVARKMQFKYYFYATFGGTIISAIVGIVFAYLGAGPWALVSQYLSSTIINSLVLWFTIKWRPSFIFSFNRLNSMVSYGWKLMGSSLLSALYINLTDMIIAKFYRPADLAYFNRGKSFPSLFVVNIITAVETVLFPSMSKIQDDPNELRNQVRNVIIVSSFVILPLVFTLAGISESLIRVLLSDKWLESAPYLSLSCISYAILPIGMANLQAIKAMGKSGLYLKLDIIKKVIGISLLLLALDKGVIAIAIADVISNLLGFTFNLYPNKKFLSYSILEQLYDVLPSLLISFFVFVVLIVEKLSVSNYYILLAVQIFTSLFLYTLLSKYLNKRAYNKVSYLVKNVKKQS